MQIFETLAAEFQLDTARVQALAELYDAGCTVPFIARYRKEAHGALDDQTIHRVLERLAYLRGLEARREEIRTAIQAQEKMTPEIEAALQNAKILSELEDIYLPFRPKRRTRATAAKEKGLEPLADWLEAQSPSGDPQAEALRYVNTENGVENAAEALQGAQDILAERIADNADIRRRLRNLFSVTGSITVKAADEEKDSVYSTYYAYSEAVSKIPDHRILAIDRGEKEGFLKVGIEIAPEKAQRVIESETVSRADSPCAAYLRQAGADSYTRLLAPSMERETRRTLTERAAVGAIRNFGVNLHELLMQPPIKNKVVLGLDPGYRTGCKAAVVDSIGRVLDTAVLYITHAQAQKEAAERKVRQMIAAHGIQIIAIGNGTASRETEEFVQALLKTVPQKISYAVVNEAGASVYSASRLAAEEFPQYDLTLRSAVSIARRLQDPLAELVKIEPRAIGVGQYQHDMPKKELETELNFVVEACVNAVGADLNTASAPLLERVSGISAAVAKNIVAFRAENGRFQSRAQLKKVPKLGPKAFEQCAGFLRISDGKNRLDATAVHPESYPAAQLLLQALDFSAADIGTPAMQTLSARVAAYGEEKLAEAVGVGVLTLRDICTELTKPARDPREELPPPLLRTDAPDIRDLKAGTVTCGTVRNVIDFGAFVDIGVHQDGLVHISQICDRFVRHPSEVLKVGQTVKVRVLSVDAEKGRIALTMKDL